MDNRALAARDHPGADQPREADCADQIGRNDALKVVPFQVDQRLVKKNAGIVDQNVDRSDGRRQMLDRLPLRLIVDGRLYRVGPLGHQRIESLLIAVGGIHDRAHVGQQPRGRTANAARGAGDTCGLSGEIEAAEKRLTHHGAVSSRGALAET